MFAFLKRLMGGGDDGGARAAEPVEIGAYLVTPAPLREASGWRVGGLIEGTVSGEPRRHQFVRADVYHGYDDAVSATIGKARRIIDEQGERMFQTPGPASTQGAD